jgi:hypothetical protein
VPPPSRTQRQPRRMRPRAILQFLHRHEVRTGQVGSLLETQNLSELAIVTTPRGAGEWSFMRCIIAPARPPSLTFAQGPRRFSSRP